MSKAGGPDFKGTLNLPATAFPMRASLPAREPEILAHWERVDVYGAGLARRAGRPRYLLHDGPPYANGNIHLGHALNKIIKDVIVKYKNMAGFQAPYVPGWDCHGLPIEHEVEKKLGKEKKAALGKVEVRRLCRDYAAKFVDVQRAEFRRLGIVGDWSNPYLTTEYGYEATEVRELAKFVTSGELYRGKKPVHWCASCQTALAEAEVEYRDVTSRAISVAFPLAEPRPPLFADVPGSIAAAIWTTTPWTLPANMAIAVNPELEYAVVARPAGDAVIAARALVPKLASILGDDPRILATVRGSELEGIRARHPWLDRDSPFVLGEHVTLDAGTGLVHTAPGHGQEDYEVGLRYGLDVYAPVDGRGRFVPAVEHFGGTFVFAADAKIIAHLEAAGRLLEAAALSHAYPHCWRCHQPIIFRATEQWFISMEAKDLRGRALAAIDGVRWIPAWGRDRIAGMVGSRPDWCISRQRAWGVPIVALRCEECGTTATDATLLAHVAGIFAEESSDAWFVRPVEDFVPPGFACPQCRGTNLAKEEDILDVWFDSGVSYSAVVERRADLGGQADLYLEGSDQHRGWFQSSLLTAVGTRGSAPFKTVLTHGFVLDEDARKMSKSVGNIVAPQQIVASHGADILRLWVAAEDYRDDVRISKEILDRASEAYRRIRNTARFLLGNLAGFDPKRDRVPTAQLIELDRFVLDRLQSLIERCRRAYDAFEFHVVYHALNNFCSVDLSALYLDIVKDRLYCEAAASLERRSGQTALYLLLEGLVGLMAPILSFTAEEIWGFMPPAPDRTPSVLLSDFPEVDPALRDPKLAAEWETLLAVRSAVTKTLEPLRTAGEIGQSLEADVRIAASGPVGDLLASRRAQLAEIFIVSRVALVPEGEITGPLLTPGVTVAAKRIVGEKCPRCWNYRADAGRDPAVPAMCGRCVGVLATAGSKA
ncbi:MAG: isoleucine--tRNA ligase [Deltaproteobacteria bacterium]|nr:isoleucine--tRNA ligase [Deltaproteobacteria bacterium]